jgi:AraC-like DNA-binding protein
MKSLNENKLIKKEYTQGAGGHILDASYFYFETAPNFNKQLAIVCGGYEKCAADFEINRTNYPYHFIKYTVKGKGTLNFKNKSYDLKPGIVSGFGPGTSHHYVADMQNPMEHIFVTFVGKEADYLLATSLLANKGILLPASTSEILEIIEKIFQIGSNKQPYSQSICCNYLRILALSLGQNIQYLESGYSRAMATYLECKKYIDNNFSSISSPLDIAEHCGINPKYMSALFKKYNLSPPYEYVMRLKLNKAANLLLASKLSVKEIAHMVGFDDQYHFSRNFKKFHNLSPSDYRETCFSYFK